MLDLLVSGVREAKIVHGVIQNWSHIVTRFSCGGGSCGIVSAVKFAK